MILLLLACATEDGPTDGLTLLSPREQLIRVSMDLRGVHPSEEELAAIEAAPSLYDDFVDRYLADERFLDRVEEVWNLRFLTRNGESYFDPSEAGIVGLDAAAVADSVADEPLKLVRHIAENDLSYAEIVLADYTLADPVVAAMWNVEHSPGVPGWETGHYKDGRPHAGILTMTTIWQRYPSMGGNANRHRANAVSKMLLCDDYLERPIVLNRSNIDQLTVDPELAIQSDSCQSCHSTLDPLAAHFFGFFHYESDNMGLREATLYRPENEEGWRDYANKSPGYYGTPTANIRELAENLVEDPRFADCAVQTAFEGFGQRSLADGDWSEFAALRDRFVADGMTLKPLVKAIVTTRPYLAASAADAATNDRLATVKTASPAQLAATIEDITGYRWTFDGRDGLTTGDLGLPVLAGGVDGNFVSTPSYSPGLGVAFVQERLAQSAGYHVADHDLDPARTDAAILLKYVTATDTPDSAPDAFDAQVRYLYLRATGLPLAADATEPAAAAVLWKQLYSVEANPTQAWAGIVSAVLRDPRVLFY